MDLGQPNRIKPPVLGGVDLLESGRERFGLALAWAPLELMKHAEFECHQVCSSRLSFAGEREGRLVGESRHDLPRKPLNIIARAAPISLLCRLQ
jgi:hypothetical protein